MVELDIQKTTRTDLSGLSNYRVNAEHLDSPGMMQDETWHDFPESAEYLGYYKKIPELKKAIDALITWTVGKGVMTDPATKVILENLTGWGEDNYQSIFWNLLVQKKAFGDSFAEIIRGDDTNKTVINLKPLYTGDIRIVVDGKGIIKRYEQRTNPLRQDVKMLKPENVLHLCNDRIGNEIHGVSVIECCKWVIDARNEAMTDYRKVLHRNVVPVRIIEIDTDNTTKRNALITEYEEAIKKGEVLVIPKGTVEFKDTQINIQDPISWITHLENFFYQAVGIPRVIASSQEFSEASSKIGYLTFEPIYTHEQTMLEGDLWNQLGMKVKFNRPPSLTGVMQENQSQNQGQVGIQESETQVTAGRVE